MVIYKPSSKWPIFYAPVGTTCPSGWMGILVWAQWKPSPSTSRMLQSKVCPVGQLLILSSPPRQQFVADWCNQLEYACLTKWTALPMWLLLDSEHKKSQGWQISVWGTELSLMYTLTLPFSNMERVGFSDLHNETSSCQEASTVAIRSTHLPATGGANSTGLLPL